MTREIERILKIVLRQRCTHQRTRAARRARTHHGPAPSRCAGPSEDSAESVRLGVGLTDIGANATPLRDLVTVRDRPLADLRGVAAGAGTGAALRTTTSAPRHNGPLLHLGAQLTSVVLVQVDLVRDAVQPKRHRVVTTV